MIMSLSPYSNSPVTASFVSVTSTAKGLSKSTFQKMKRECFPNDKTNFSIDKRLRFFIRLCQCCVVMHLSLQMFLFSFFLKIYLDLDLSVTGKKKMMMKHNFGSRKLSPSGYHRRGKGEKEKKKMDAFSKMLKIGKKSERLTGFQLPSWLPNSVGLPH